MSTPTPWTYDIGAGGWGNNEFEYYTNRPSDAFVTNGQLHIVAHQQSIGGGSYTSARMKSQGLFSCNTGASNGAQNAQGVGCWPPSAAGHEHQHLHRWPGCGEIDVMENNGSDPSFAQGKHPFRERCHRRL